MLTVNDVLKGCGNCRLAWDVASATRFDSVTQDSRLAKPGSLFVAIRGERDGHDFIADAYARGARGAIGERLPTSLDWLPAAQRSSFAYFLVPKGLDALQSLAGYWRQAHQIETVGITGSVGKTTAKELIAGLLARRFRVLKNEKNFNNEIGLPLTLLSLRPNHQVAVMEMGMYTLGEITSLCRIAQPRIGVVTNVGPTHLERLGSIERIAQAKSELVQALPTNGLAVLNGDDDRVRRMAQAAPCRVITFGCDQACDLRATDIVSHGLDGIEFTLRWNGHQQRVTTSLLGKHNVYACLAASAVALEMGLTVPEIVAGLERPPQQIRLSVLKGPRGSTIIDDTYNASPASTIAALELLSETKGRRVAILGDMFELGDYEETGHREVGHRAAHCVDTLIAVGDRSRWIAEEARSAGLADVKAVSNRDDVELTLGQGDVVLVKGSRGMRMEDIVNRLMREKYEPADE